MPQDFNKCQAEGGRIVTIPLSGDHYMHVCYDKQNKAHAGDVKKKQPEPKK